jgi:hypothetical protein
VSFERGTPSGTRFLRSSRITAARSLASAGAFGSAARAVRVSSVSGFWWPSSFS